MERRRVVVSGLGAVTSLALSMEGTWRELLAGSNGVGPIPEGRFPTTDFRTTFAGIIADFDSSEHFTKPETRKLDLFSQFSLLASREALSDSGLDLEKVDLDRFGCVLGTGIGGIVTIEQEGKVLNEKGPRRVSPHFIPKMMPNAMAARVSIEHGLRGPSFVTGSACASAGHALGVALRSIQSGECDLIVSGGAEGSISPLSLSTFGAMKALSTRNDDPEHASRPFDKDRDGFVMGEGAGILILEERDHALARQARIYAEFAGYGSTTDAFHITKPKEDALGPTKAIQLALQDGQVTPESVDYVNAHGTSTHFNDLVETTALHQAFQGHASSLAVSSTKSMVGHLLGGSAALEAAVTCRSISDGCVHPTRNHIEAGEGCDLDYIPGESREISIRNAISNSLGFGGHNVSLLFSAHDPS